MNTQLFNPDIGHIQHCAQALLHGQLVAFPTETVFGLGAAITQPQALAAIFTAKGRPANHPLIAHVSWPWVQQTLQQQQHGPVQGLHHHLQPWVGALTAQQQADWQALAQAFWPGPLTLIVPKGEQMPLQVTGGQASVGIRCPSHPVAQALLAQVGVPVAAPSANRFGKVSPTRAAHVLAELGGRIPYVLDGEVPSVGIESTIVSLLGPQPVVLRPGAILAEDLARVLGRPVLGGVVQADAVRDETGEPLRASGLLAQHYSPSTPMCLCSAADLPVAQLPKLGPWMLLGWSSDFISAAQALQQQTQAMGVAVVLCPLPPNPTLVAQQLYLALRQADEQQCAALWVERPPVDAAWAAVADRLQRAANQVG